MPVFHVEMMWRCATCEVENRGRNKSCQGCGKAKEGEPFYDAPGTETPTVADAVTDAALIRQATAGADWECRFCSSHQRRDNGACAECGAHQGESREHETKWDDGKRGRPGQGFTVLEEIQRADREDIRESEEKLARETTLSDTEAPVYEALLAEELRQKRQNRAARGSYRRVAVSRPTPTALEVAPASSPNFDGAPARALAGLLAIIVLSVCGYFLFRTRIVDASVTSVAWTHTVNVERFQKVSEEGFYEDRPGDAVDVQGMGKRHHHYKKVPDGTKTEPYEEVCGEICETTPVRCSRNDNGFKTCSGGDQDCKPKKCPRTREVPKYKNVSVEEDWYSWRAWRWRHHRVVKTEGSDNNPYPPTETAIALNRHCGLGERERTSVVTSYRVTFQAPDGETHGYTPAGESEFRRLVPGTQRKLKVRILGANELVP